MLLKDFLIVFKEFSLYKIDLYVNHCILTSMDDLVTCEYCGNVWDGNAQCNCYESMIEPDEQIMDMVSSSNNIAVETGNEQQVETDEQIMGLVAPSNYTTVVIQSDIKRTWVQHIFGHAVCVSAGETRAKSVVPTYRPALRQQP